MVSLILLVSLSATNSSKSKAYPYNNMSCLPLAPRSFYRVYLFISIAQLRFNKLIGWLSVEPSASLVSNFQLIDLYKNGYLHSFEDLDRIIL